jgi:predicted dehydrogenase
MTEVMAASAAQALETEIVAVASRSPDRAAAFAQRHRIPRAYGSYRDLLADSDVEAVYISTPNSLHVEWSLEALNAGKHVLCEKPLTRSEADAKLLVGAARSAERALVEGFMYRHNPAIADVRRIVDQGLIGDLRLVRASWTVSFSDPEYVAFSPALDGGVLMALGCYGVHACRLLAGEPVSLHGERLLGATGVDIVYCGLMRFAHGLIGAFDVAFGLADRPELELVGTQGSLLLTDPWYGTKPELAVRRDGLLERSHPARVDPYRLELEHVARVSRDSALAELERRDLVHQARALEGFWSGVISA